MATVSVATSGPIATLSIECQGALGQTCAGSVILTAQEQKVGQSVTAVTAAASARSAERHKRPPNSRRPPVTVAVTLGYGSYIIATGQRGTVAITLNRTGRMLLSRFYSLPVTVTFSAASLAPQTIRFTYPRLNTSVSWQWSWINQPCASCYTTVKELTVTGAPRDAHIHVLCDGTGCHSGAASPGTKVGMSRSLHSSRAADCSPAQWCRSR
jgi:hypothetical protein